MDRVGVKQQLLDFQQMELHPIERRTNLRTSKKIQTVVGARRVGKTYLLFNKIVELERSGVPREQMLYLNFESPLLHDISYKEIKEIVGIHWSLFPQTTNKQIYIFIDEPQEIDNWELAVRELYESYNLHIFLTGSSSKLLSKEIATELRGRAITTLLLPLTFREFLRFRKLDADPKKLSTQGKALLIRWLEDFLEFGGYPEVVLEENKTEKLRILKEYFDLTIYKDIVERYDVKNTRLIRWLISSLVESASKEVSINKIYLMLKSRGIKVSKNTLYDYFSMLQDSFFVFTLKKFDSSMRKRELSIPKIYLGDVGFLNLFSMEEHGRRLENVVFLNLLDKKNDNPLLDIHYWTSPNGKEVDFIVSNGKLVISAIQVCFDISNAETRNKEIKSLLSALNYFKLKEGTIVTKDEERTEYVEEKKINFVPVWKWLLE